MTLDAIAAERDEILGLFRRKQLSEHVLHRIERDLDLREARLKLTIQSA